MKAAGRSVILALCLLLVLAVPVADAKRPRSQRMAEGTYDIPAAGPVAVCSQTDAQGCVALPTELGERSFKAVVRDAHNQPVFVQVSANTDGSPGDDEIYGTFCGQTPARVPFSAGVELHFFVGHAAGEAVGCGLGAGPATSGTISVTFRP